jgi:hypothetical protein
MTTLGVARRVGSLEARDFRFRRNGDDELRYNTPKGAVTAEDAEFLTAAKPDVLRLIEEWDEESQKERLSGAYDWADRTTPPGCWAWCCRHRRDLRLAYDEIDVAICDAFQERDAAGLADALHRFGDLVRAAVQAFRGAPDVEREQAGREYVEARARTAAWTEGAEC